MSKSSQRSIRLADYSSCPIPAEPTQFACLDPKASARLVAPPHRLGGYRGEPKTPRTDLSSAGSPRLRGALAVPMYPGMLMRLSHPLVLQTFVAH